mmetsp:Transcript_130556/g.194443  ORF Transcript_130556/g.194443 Transcript_130556/m.194443 type:complete len:420 (+) Transcript_130556:228-1487(+)
MKKVGKRGSSSMPSSLMRDDIGCINSPSSSEELLDVEVEGYIHTDAERLMTYFKDAYDKVRNGLKRPRVLIAGVAGAGKSSIINTVFGSDMAKEGAGRPVTQHFHRFEPKDKPIILYDSKGLEVGMQLEEFISTTRAYFTQLNNGDEERCMEQQIDVVWYIVNSAAARFQDFEEQICKQLFKNLPIIFILNKSDISTKEQREALCKVILEMNLSNCIGTYGAVTQKYCTNSPTACVSCGCPDLVIYRRDKLCVCEECGHTFSSIVPTGLEEIMQAVVTALPHFVKDSFVATQRVSFQLKEERARKIITEFYNDQTKTMTTHGLFALMSTLLTRLSNLWDFKEHAHLSAIHIARDAVGHLSLRDKIFLFIHKNKHQRLRSTAIGIIWNSCVRELAKIMLIESVEGVSKKNCGRPMAFYSQ